MTSPLTIVPLHGAVGAADEALYVVAAIVLIAWIVGAALGRRPRGSRQDSAHEPAASAARPPRG